MLQSHHHCVRISLALRSYQNLVYSVLLVLAYLIDMYWYVIVGLVCCISMMANDVEHLFTSKNPCNDIRPP